MARMDISVREVDYVAKKAPCLSVCRLGRGKGEFDTALGLALDEKNKHIYICDHKNNRIQVVSLEGEFVREFGRDQLRRPWDIFVTDKCILVTDIWHCYVIQFEKETLVVVNKAGEFGREEGQLIWPGGLAGDSNGDIYVADTFNHRISVFTEDLKFKFIFGKGKLKLPKDIKITADEVLVLDHSEYCVHVMSRSGETIRSIISQGDTEGAMVFGADFFHLDRAGNVVVSNRKHDNINIFSKQGGLIRTLGGHGMERGELVRPKGIGVTEKGAVFVVSENPNYVLQAF